MYGVYAADSPHADLPEDVGQKLMGNIEVTLKEPLRSRLVDGRSRRARVLNNPYTDAIRNR